MNTTLKNYIMRAVAISPIAMGAMILMITPLEAQANAIKDTPDSKTSVRIMKNEDGSYTEFRRSSDERVIERRTYGDRPGGNGDRVLRMCVIYRKDAYGKLRSGKIYDGSGQVLYRVVYGYHRRTGKLAAEDMFDARVKRTKPVTDANTGVSREIETPVRRLYHRYDAQGRASAPVVFCAPAGKRAEQLFGKNKGSHEGADPWAEEARTINPNARRTK